MTQKLQWLGVSRIIVRRGTRLEQEDAQVRVCDGESTGDNARGRATCHSRLVEGITVT